MQHPNKKLTVIPAKAGIQQRASARSMRLVKLKRWFLAEPLMTLRLADANRWIPASAGMTACLILLAACVSGTPPSDSYTNSSGKKTIIQSDRDMCIHSCNDDYARCMDTDSAQSSGINAPAGMFGVSADCRSDLKKCLPSCKGQ